jgi:hypothetical protein
MDSRIWKPPGVHVCLLPLHLSGSVFLEQPSCSQQETVASFPAKEGLAPQPTAGLLNPREGFPLAWLRSLLTRGQYEGIAVNLLRDHSVRHSKGPFQGTQSIGDISESTLGVHCRGSPRRQKAGPSQNQVSLTIAPQSLQILPHPSSIVTGQPPCPQSIFSEPLRKSHCAFHSKVTEANTHLMPARRSPSLKPRAWELREPNLGAIPCWPAVCSNVTGSPSLPRAF